MPRVLASAAMSAGISSVPVTTSSETSPGSILRYVWSASLTKRSYP